MRGIRGKSTGGEAAAGNVRRRLPEYDLVRALAMVGVIAVHSLAIIDTSTHKGALFELGGQALFFTANALFFMLSGKFNLKEVDDDHLSSYYLRKCRGILIPTLTYFLVRTFYDRVSMGGGGEFWLVSFVKNSLWRYNGIEYWFIFTLVSFLAVVPFLAPVFARPSAAKRRLFLCLGFTYLAALYVLTNRGHNFAWGFVFGGFLFPFCLGPSIEWLFASRDQRHVLYVCGAAAWVLSVFLMYRYGWMSGAFGSSPLYMVLSIALYLGILGFGRRHASLCSSAPVTFVARHSFGVYLTHMMILLPLRDWFFAWQPVSPYVGYLPFTCVVFVAALAAAFVVDSLLVTPAQRLFDHAVSALQKGKTS